MRPAKFDLVVVLALACAGDGPWTATPAAMAEGARILAVETIGGKSHWNFMSAVIRALLDRGHHVTAFTPFPGGGPTSENYTEVDVSGVVPKVLNTNLEDAARQWSDPVGMVGPLVTMSRQMCDAIYGHPEMRRLLDRHRRRRADDDAFPVAGTADFDAVLIEPLVSGCASYAAHLMRSPLVYLVPMSDVAMSERLYTGHFPHPVVQSNVMARHVWPVTFAQRLYNTYLTAYWEIARAYHEAVLGRTDPRDYDLVGPVAPSLVFINGHFTSSAPSAVSAEVVNVGGVHLKRAEPLPRVRVTNTMLTRINNSWTETRRPKLKNKHEKII